MLQPARRKYRKEQKGRNKGIATRGNKVSFGEFGLKAVERGRLTARQIEAARRALDRLRERDVARSDRSGECRAPDLLRRQTRCALYGEYAAEVQPQIAGVFRQWHGSRTLFRLEGQRERGPQPQ